MFNIIYAGESSEDYGMLVYQRPNIRVAKETINESDIPGRTSNLYRRSGNYEAVKIDVQFNFVAKADEWGEAFRKAIVWLRKDGDLQMSDDMSVYRKVYSVEIGDNARSVKQYGKFKATFYCYPGEYYVDGAEFHGIGDIATSSNGAYQLENAYTMAQPLYRITGNGSCDLTVNGETVNIAINTGIVIDTDRKISYDLNGNGQNTALEGDYDDLQLQPGTNEIAISSGFVLEIQPNWRVI